MKPPTTSCQNHHPSSPCSPASAMAGSGSRPPLFAGVWTPLATACQGTERSTASTMRQAQHHHPPAKPFSCSRDTILDHPMRIPPARSGRRCWRRPGALDGAGRLGFGIQDTTAAFSAAPLKVPERPNLGHLHFRTRRRKNSRSAFWSHAMLAVLANLSTSRPKRRSLRHGVTR